MEQRSKIPPGLPRENPTKSYWQDPPSDIADCRTTPDLPTHADVVIIGSGLSGASISYNLLSSEPNLRVVMLEARQAASGASGRNGGHTKPATYRSFSDNVHSVGAEDAMKITRLEQTTMEAVHAFAHKHQIDCDSHRCQTVDVFYDLEQLQAARESVALMEKLMDPQNCPKHIFHDGKTTAERFLAQDSMGAVEYESGSLNAYKFTIGILKLALQKGLNLQCNTPAIRISKSDTTNPNASSVLWTISTASRGTITTPKLVLATNAYSAHLYPPLQGVVVPLRGVVTAQRPGLSISQRSCGRGRLDTTYSFVHEGDFEYMITRPSRDQTDINSNFDIVIGGGMHVAPRGGLDEYGNTDDTTYDKASAEYLLQCTKNKYFNNIWGPDNSDGQCRSVWSGIMAFSADGYPFVGPVPGEQGLFLHVSFQGHGMVLCFSCARAAASMILDSGKNGEQDEAVDSSKHSMSSLDSWFPNCYRVTSERLSRKFTDDHLP
ncbi:hypothetical protein ABEF92_006907 [Exophiala dermatitidis]|uniref:FAD dependent oxidoreductase domain-containing protein n=1 Tax=Exophiala dermatitidis (strain ATCC 34100 / CBS 525.76 / NIH/UT8656) TaxID=858893 RepID=H6C085_EXODN|nr:uncharacterized protein HMPREF1120_04449 [Exophiala dermatitidis NIH/UT8656]EHY56367.1 hypothetical protein HMPREF1120_04449 [Exophiala dermatitidis NIH/UT8656]